MSGSIAPNMQEFLATSRVGLLMQRGNQWLDALHLNSTEDRDNVALPLWFCGFISLLSHRSEHESPT